MAKGREREREREREGGERQREREEVSGYPFPFAFEIKGLVYRPRSKGLPRTTLLFLLAPPLASLVSE